MPVVIHERFISGNRDAGAKGPITLEYVAIGSDLATDVLAQVAIDVPLSYNGLPRQSAPRLEFVGNTVWYVTATYVLASDPAPPLQLGDAPRWTYSTAGGTIRKTHAELIIAWPGPGYDTVPYHDEAINVSDQGVEGVDVIVPAGTWTRSQVISAAQATDEYINLMHDLSGSVNDGDFKLRPAGEVLYEFTEFASRSDGNVDMSQTFRISRNVVAEEIAGVPGVDKDGWDYLWIWTQKTEDPDAHSLVERVRAVYVHRPYKRIDFAQLDPPGAMTKIRRAQTGARQSLRAGDWNFVAENAEFVAQQRNAVGARVGGITRAADIVRIKNTTESALAIGHVVALAAAVFLPTDNVDAFKLGPPITGSIPDAGTGGRVGVIAEPIPVDGIGFAVVIGVAVARLEVTNAGALTCVEKPGSSDRLITGAGSIDILWKAAVDPEAPEEPVWATVRIGGGGGAIFDYVINHALTELLAGTPKRWKYFGTRGATDPLTGLVTAVPDRTAVIMYNDAEDTGDGTAHYQHGQLLVLGVASMTIGPVQGVVPAWYSGVNDEEGTPIYRFDEYNPAVPGCGVGA